MRIQDNVIVVEFDEQGKLIGSPYKGELVQENNYVNVIEARFPLTGTSDTDSAQSIGARLYCRLPDAEGTVVAYPREIINGVVKANENLVYDDETGKFKCRFRLTRRVTRLKGNIFMTIALIERTEDLYTDDDENQHNIYAVRNQSGFYVSCKESQYEENVDSEEDQELIDEIYDQISILKDTGSGDRFLADDGAYKSIPVCDMGSVPMNDENLEETLLTFCQNLEKTYNDSISLFTFLLNDYKGVCIFDYTGSRFYIWLYKGADIRQFRVAYDDADVLTVSENFGFALKSEMAHKADLDENGKIKKEQMPDGYDEIEYFMTTDFPDLSSLIADNEYGDAEHATIRNTIWEVLQPFFPNVDTRGKGREPDELPIVGFGYTCEMPRNLLYCVRVVGTAEGQEGYFIRVERLTNQTNHAEIYIDDKTNVQYRIGKYEDYNSTVTFQNFFAEISASLALGETSQTAFAGDRGKANTEAIEELKATVSSTGFGDLRIAKMFFCADTVGGYQDPSHFIDKTLVIESTPLTAKEVEYFNNGQLVLFFADRGNRRHKNYDKVYTVPRSLWFREGYDDTGEPVYLPIRDKAFFLNRMIGKNTADVNVLGADCAAHLTLKVQSTGEKVIRLEMKWCEFLARQLYENADLSFYDHIGLTYSECPYVFGLKVSEFDSGDGDIYSKFYIHFHNGVDWLQSSIIRRKADVDNLVSFDSMTLYYKTEHYGDLFQQLTQIGTAEEESSAVYTNLSNGDLNEGLSRAYVRNRYARRQSGHQYGRIHVATKNHRAPNTPDPDVLYLETNPLSRLRYGFETNFKPCFLILKENFEGIKPTEDGVRMYEKKYPFFDKKIYTVFKLKCTSVSKDDPTRDDSKILLQFKSSIV